MASPSPAIDSAQAVMARPAGTLVVGPRPASRRRWNRVSWKLVVALEAALCTAGLLAAGRLGAFDEARAWMEPVVPIASAPTRIKWLDLPSSPFLDAGYDAAGNFSVPRMLGAWRDAGMTTTEALQALDEIVHLRPVLMGRADPLLERQLHAEAAAAARRLANRHPHELDALVRRQASGGEGFLSPEVVDPMAWTLVLPEMERRLGQGEQPRGWKLAVLVDRAVAWNQSVDPLQSLPLPAHLQAGFKDGQWSLERMLQVWRRAGMDPSTAGFVLDELARALPDLAPLAQHQRSRAIIAAREASAGLERLDPEILARLPLAASGQAFPISPGSLPASLTEEEIEGLWEDLAHFDDRRPTPPAHVDSMDQARALLAQAVEQTGLRALTLSLDQWRSPEEVALAASNLVKANALLEHATGWEGGKVLGLDGRVELAIGEPTHIPMAEGVARVDRSGRLQIAASWSALAHEWYHGFDYTASRMVMTHSLQQPLSRNLKPLRLVEEDRPYQAMKELVEATRIQAPRWASARRQMSESGSWSYYWIDPAETLAFGFSAHLKHNLSADLIVHSSASTHPAPDGLESQALAPFYTAVFRAAAPPGPGRTAFRGSGFGPGSVAREANRIRPPEHGPARWAHAHGAIALCPDGWWETGEPRLSMGDGDDRPAAAAVLQWRFRLDPEGFHDPASPECPCPRELPRSPRCRLVADPMAPCAPGHGPARGLRAGQPGPGPRAAPLSPRLRSNQAPARLHRSGPCAPGRTGLDDPAGTLPARFPGSGRPAQVAGVCLPGGGTPGAAWRRPGARRGVL